MQGHGEKSTIENCGDKGLEQKRGVSGNNNTNWIYPVLVHESMFLIGFSFAFLLKC